jgi:hypothetical protein
MLEQRDGDAWNAMKFRCAIHTDERCNSGAAVPTPWLPAAARVGVNRRFNLRNGCSTM